MTWRIDPEGAETCVLGELVSLDDLRVLELGCGDGRLTFRYARAAKSVLAIDLDAQRIEKAHENLPPELAGTVTFAVASAEAVVAPHRSFDVALFSWSPNSPDYLWKGIFGAGGDQNLTGYRQRLVTSDLDQAERILDAARQTAALNRADAQMAKDVPAIPLYEQSGWAAISPDLRNFAPIALDPLVGAENWWLDR